MKMLCGILVPTSGQVKVNGLVPWKEREKNARRIGVVFGQRTQLWWDIPLSETLNLMRRLYNVAEEQYRENMRIFHEVLDVDSFIHTPIRQLSLGQRMRADLCCALLHNPDILYLDEPTIGLDVLAKEAIRNLILEINRLRGTTVILATHDMVDIEKTSTRVMVINYGHIMYDGGLTSLRQTYGTEETLKADISGRIDDVSNLYQLGVQDVEQEDSYLSVKYDTEVVSSSVILSWLMQRTEVKDFKVETVEVEDIIRRMYRAFSA